MSLYSFFGRCDPTRAMAYSLLRFLDHSQRCSTVSTTPMDGWSARRRDLYLTTNNTHNRQTSMPPAGFEPSFPAIERPQTHALDRAAPGISRTNFTALNIFFTRYQFSKMLRHTPLTIQLVIWKRCDNDHSYSLMMACVVCQTCRRIVT
jgi:hypothetical protein